MGPLEVSEANQTAADDASFDVGVILGEGNVSDKTGPSKGDSRVYLHQTNLPRLCKIDISLPLSSLNINKQLLH